MRLADICEAIVDCEHKTSPEGDGFAFAVGTKAMKGGRLVLEGARPVSEETYETWTRRMRPVPGDLILAREAPVGDVVRVPESPRICLGQRTVLIRPDESRVLPRFLHYWLLGPDAQGVMRAQTGGATVGHLNVGDIRKLDVGPMPTAPRHQAVTADLLGSLDDLIENNRRRVEVLEEIARAIYREWFVEFRYPGHEDVPLVDSAVGLIPDGWEETTLGAAARWFSGGTPKTTVADYWNGDLPWITSGTLTSMLLDRSDRMLTELGAANGTRVVERDALLFVVRGMSLAKEFRVGIADARLAFGQDVKALVASPGIDPMYLALSVITRAEKIQRMVEFAGHGTGKISTDRLQALHVLRPPMELQRHFADSFRPLREMMTALKLAGDRLVRLRDDLLPKLVTGQIDVSTLDVDGLDWSSSTAGVGAA